MVFVSACSCFFEKSEEGSLDGFGFFPGSVLKFSEDLGLPVPHMGWNTVRIKKQSPVFKNIPEGSFFYFAHSYYVAPKNREITGGVTKYGIEFVSVVEKDNIIGFQFHPEKSSLYGQKLIENFLKLK